MHERARENHAAAKIRNKVRTAILFVLLGILVFTTAASSAQPFSSVEVQFADRSASGLAIVPASCPSSPHYDGQCDGTPPPGWDGCSITATPYITSSGGSVTLQWNAEVEAPFRKWYTYNSGTITPEPGSVPVTGSSVVHPPTTTRYEFLGTNRHTSGGLFTFKCDATVSVSNTSCPQGQVLQGGQCVPQCPAGYAFQNGQCVPQCPAGYAFQNGQCVLVACPLGYTLQSGSCVFTGCPLGYSLQGQSCVALGGQCTAQYFCIGDDLYYKSANCQNSFSQTCTYGCSGNACNGAPSPTIVIWNVRPVLVQKGTAVRVTWEAQGVASCSVRGTNGDGSGENATGLWNTKSDDKTTSPILGQTIYTITCRALAGASPATISRSTTVNIVPIFEEQ